MSVDSSIVDFEAPPVVSVVCSVVFKDVYLSTPHIGLLWTSWFDELPLCRDLPLTAHHIVAKSEVSSAIGHEQFEVSAVPPVPRIAFSTEDTAHSLQIQRDFLSYSWRKTSEQQDYPRFGKVYKRFSDYLTTFSGFIESNELGTIQPLEFQLQYINHIPKGNGWTHPAELLGVLPQFDASRAAGKFLPKPDAVNLEWVYFLDDLGGRLDVRVRSFPHKDHVLLVLACRGIGHNNSMTESDAWFEKARSCIVNGFMDLTDPGVQESHWRIKV